MLIRQYESQCIPIVPPELALNLSERMRKREQMGRMRSAISGAQRREVDPSENVQRTRAREDFGDEVTRLHPPCQWNRPPVAISVKHIDRVELGARIE